MDREACWVMVQGVTESQQSDSHLHTVGPWVTYEEERDRVDKRNQ